MHKADGGECGRILWLQHQRLLVVRESLIVFAIFSACVTEIVEQWFPARGYGLVVVFGHFLHHFIGGAQNVFGLFVTADETLKEEYELVRSVIAIAIFHSPIVFKFDYAQFVQHKNIQRSHTHCLVEELFGQFEILGETAFDADVQQW